jgi:hypothetical protein
VFGDEKTYQTNKDRIPHRTLKSLHDELRWLYNRIMEQKEPGFKWDYSVTSETDRVFPAKNLNGYWEKEKDTIHIKLRLPHYFFHKWKSFTDFISFVENHKSVEKKQRKSSIKKTKDL